MNICFIKSRIRQQSRARKAGCFAVGLSRLKSCVCFIKSRIRNCSRVAIPSPVGGFGLVETLITAGVGLTIGMGMLKVSQVSLQTSQMIETSFAERDLSYSIRQVLSNPADCKWNLEPGRTGGLSSDGTGALSALKKTYGSTNPSEYVTVIEKGVFSNKLEVVKLEFSSSGSANERTFKVYYKKKNLGSYSSLGDCTAGDTSGCYFKSCKVDYAFSGTTVNTCDLLNCAGMGGDTAVGECRDNEYLRGFDKSGRPVCSQMVQPGLAPCEQGRFLTGFDDDGEPVCRILCGGGRTWNDQEGACVCPDSSKPHWSGASCISCEGGQTYQTGVGCLCPAGSNWNGSACITCTGGKTWSGTACVCPPYKPEWNGTACTACPTARPNWDGSNCRACPPANPKWTGFQCSSCPSHKPKWDSATSDCIACPSNRPKWDSATSTCTACPSANPKWTGFRCSSCPSHTPKWDSATSDCIACPSNRPKWDGSTCTACPSANPKWSGFRCSKCPSHKPKWDSATSTCTACPSGSNWNGSACITCTGGKVWDSRSCICPSHKPKWDGAKCVPCTGRRIWDTSSSECVCPSDMQYDDSKGECVCRPDRPYWSKAFLFSIRQHFTVAYKPKGCSRCPGDLKWNGSDCVCFTGGIKRGNSCICPSGQYSWNLNNLGIGRLTCLPCPTGSQVDGIICRCHEATPKFSADDRSCEACPAEKPAWIGSRGRCNTCSNEYGSEYHFTGSECLKCGGDLVYDSSRKTCVCPAGEKEVQRNGHNISCCPNNSDWNGSTCLNCGGGLYDSSRKTCVCPAGEKEVQRNGHNISCCPNNSDWNGSTCLNCGGGLYDSSRKTCVCPAGEKEVQRNGHNISCCPNNSDWNGSTCLNCGGGLVYDSSRKTCVCPAGEKEVQRNGNNISCCPNNSDWNGSNCILRN